MNAKSKNAEAAKEELRRKMEQLDKGKLPKEYKDIVHTKKQFTSKESFINNPHLEDQFKKPPINRDKNNFAGNFPQNNQQRPQTGRPPTSGTPMSGK